MSDNEPAQLRRGKESHKEVQRDWLGTAQDGNILFARCSSDSTWAGDVVQMNRLSIYLNQVFIR